MKKIMKKFLGRNYINNKFDDVNRRFDDVNRRFDDVYHTLEGMNRTLEKNRADMQTLQKSVEQVLNMMRVSTDITKVPKAVGLMRKTQLAQTKMLSLFTDITNYYGLRMFASGGTMLGIVRHNNDFIPWDDDVDADIPLDDWLALIKILEQITKGTDFSFSVDIAIRIYYKQTEFEKFSQDMAAIKIDIHAVQPYPLNIENEKAREVFKSKVDRAYEKQNEFINDVCTKPVYMHEYIKKFVDTNREIIFDESGGEENWFSFPSLLAILRKYHTCSTDVLFPLKEASLCGYPVNLIANPIKYLESYYDDYLAWPDDILTHHGKPSDIFNQEKTANWDEFLNTPNEVYFKQMIERAK